MNLAWRALEESVFSLSVDPARFSGRTDVCLARNWDWCVTEDDVSEKLALPAASGTEGGASSAEIWDAFVLMEDALGRLSALHVVSGMADGVSVAPKWGCCVWTVDAHFVHVAHARFGVEEDVFLALKRDYDVTAPDV